MEGRGNGGTWLWGGAIMESDAPCLHCIGLKNFFFLDWVGDRFGECCPVSKKLPSHGKTLEKILDSKLYGQHLVRKIVPGAVQQHLRSDNPEKPLVISFHGYTGTGKNFVSGLIAEYIYKLGYKSRYVHLRIADAHYPDENKLQEYKKEIWNLVVEKTKLCKRSLFIFDEVDKMPKGLLEVLRPFLDTYVDMDGMDYRKNIFIFLSNIGGDAISNLTLTNHKAGKKREDLTSKDMEHILSLSSLQSKGGLGGHGLIVSGVVDFFIPFLPMERFHVKQCITDHILQNNLKLIDGSHLKYLDEIADELQYYPPVEKLYSLTGCKKVHKKVDIFVRTEL